MGAELLANVADESNRRHRCASIKPICSNRLMPAKQASFEAIAASPANNSNARHSSVRVAASDVRCVPKADVGSGLSCRPTTAVHRQLVEYLNSNQALPWL
jgi:hypothetical protein